MKRTFSTILHLCFLWIGIQANVTPVADNDTADRINYPEKMANNDTVTRMNYPEKVVIRTEGDSIFIQANGFVTGKGYGTYTYTYSAVEQEEAGSDWEVNLPFVGSYRENKRNKGKSRNGVRLSIDWFDNFYVGGVAGINGRPKGQRGGWEIGVDNLVGAFLHTGRRGPVFSLGMGLGYRGINYGSGRMLAQKGKELVIVGVNENYTAHSRLHLFRLSVPFMITQPLGCGMALRVGAILNLNTYASATTKVNDGNMSVKQSFHSLEQRFATPDFLGSWVMGHHIGIYARWSPVSLFSSDWGPCCRTVSFGVNFVL